MSSFRGFPACSCLIDWLPVYEAELLRRGLIKKNLDIYQLIGGAPRSGGTHLDGQCADTAQVAAEAIEVARDMGADASWHRRYDWDNRGGVEHAHLNLRGCPHGTPAADRQYSSTFSGVDHGKNGLANGGRDDGPRPLSKRSYKAGITWAKKQGGPLPTFWYVHVERLYPHKGPDVNAPVAKGSVGYGGRLWVTEYRTVYGTLWGKTLTGRWWILGGNRASRSKPPVRYWVTSGTVLHPHADADVKSKVLPGEVTAGKRLDIRGTKRVWGTLWGYTVLAGVKRWWILGGGRTSQTAPVPPPAVVTFAEVGTWNLAAQNASHNETWRPYRAAQAVRRMVAADVDVMLVQETGSGLYLDALDDELEDSGIVRVNGGGHWRHLLRNTKTTVWDRDSATDLLTLGTKVDGDGNQIALGILTVDGVRAGFCSLHFDVNATKAQHQAQASETLELALAWFADRDVDPINVTFGGDTNDNTGTVLAVFAEHGFVSAADVAEQTSQADLKTNNRWSVDPVEHGDHSQLDVLLVHEDVQVTDWRQIWDTDEQQTSDHNFLSCIRGYYR